MSDYSDEEDPNDFVFFGHSLDPLEDDEVAAKKPIRIEDQVVTDENGRRRFHGAFTGGFSAGYYNTVGSKEGWRPATFKSSRSDRAKVQHSVQDYMDEEDVGAFGFAPQVLRAKEDFATTAAGRKRPRPVYSAEGAIPGLPVLQDLLRPVRESIGLRLLRAMGWRPGQGVGERITRKEKKQRKKRTDPLKVFGCPLPQKAKRTADDDESSDEASEDEGHLFAPDDVPSFLVKPKDNSFGLGYSGLVPRDSAAGRTSGFVLFEPTLSITDKNRKVRIAGQAFGVGAFEDDDDDIYSRDDMSQYDFILGGEKPKEKKGQKLLALPSTDTLDGFVKASKPEPVPKIFPPPTLPRDFVAVHRTRKSRFDVAPMDETALKGLGRHQLDSLQRAAILGESKIVPPAVPPIVPPAPALATLTSKAAPAPSVPKPAQARPPPREEPKTDNRKDPKWSKQREEVLDFIKKQKPVEKGSLFQPFVRDAGKQERFDGYILLSQSGRVGDFKYLQPDSMTEWERERERNEFERAFALYRPLSGQMQNRFSSGGHFEESIEGGLGTFVPPSETAAKIETVETEQDPARRAAKMKMFGRLTRQKNEWRPDRLLCVRFNVPNPYPSAGSQPAGKPAPKRGPREFSIFDVLNTNSYEAPSSKSTVTNQQDQPKPKVPEEVKSLEWDRAERGETVNQVGAQTVEVDEEKEPVEEAAPQRPPMDFFKAIFESDEEEEEPDERKDEGKETNEKEVKEESRPKEGTKSKIVEETESSGTSESSGEDSQDTFGPRAPTSKRAVPTTSIARPLAVPARNDDYEWVEKSDSDKKKKMKKKKDKKEHKKSKNKKKHHKDDRSKKHKHKSKSPDLDEKLVKKLAKLSKGKSR